MKLTRTDLIFINNYMEIGIWMIREDLYAIVHPLTDQVLVNNIQSFQRAHEIITKIRQYHLDNPLAMILNKDILEEMLG